MKKNYQEVQIFNIVSQLIILWGLMSKERKNSIFKFFAALILTSIVELIGVGLVIPFMTIIGGQSGKLGGKEPLLSLLKDDLSIENIQQALLTIFVLITVLAAALKIILSYVIVSVSRNIGTEFSVRAYAVALYKDLSFHSTKNSSDIITAIFKARDLSSYLIQPALQLVASLLLLILFVVMLSAVDIYITLSVIAILGLYYYIAVSFLRKRISLNGNVISKSQVDFLKALNEGTGGIRDVIINESQGTYIELYRASLERFQRAVIANQIASVTPRYGIEAIGMIFLACIAYLTFDISQSSVVLSNKLAVLITFAVAAQKVMPLVQQAYVSVVALKTNFHSAADAIELLRGAPPHQSKLTMCSR